MRRIRALLSCLVLAGMLLIAQGFDPHMLWRPVASVHNITWVDVGWIAGGVVLGVGAGFGIIYWLLRRQRIW